MLNDYYGFLKNQKQKELLSVDEMLASVAEDEPNLKEYFSRFLFLAPKRIRPLVILLLADLLKIPTDLKLFRLCAGVELLHSASLIHDDILDDAEIRRNEPCIHLKIGNKKAVLAGDYLISCAIDTISQLNNIEVLKIFSKCALMMTKTEINSLFSRFKTLSLDEYLNNAKNKTSALFVAAVKSMFLINGLEVDSDICLFVEKFSLGFQIKDDINNFTNNDKTKLASDIKEGIYTLPFILLNEKGSSCDIIQESYNFLDNILNQSLNHLSNTPDSKEKELVVKLIESLKERA